MGVKFGMRKPRTCVLATSMACPLGMHTRSAAAAIRAGISRFGEVAGVLDAAGEVARASRLATLDPGLSRTDRAVYFARHALAEVLAGLYVGPPATLSLYLAEPEPNQDGSLDIGRLVGEMIAVAARAPQPFELVYDPKHRFPHGRAGFFHALEAAITALACDDSHIAVVGAADSLAHDDAVRSLARKDRLLGATNKDGVIPGEAAAFIALVSAGSPLAKHATATVDATALFKQPALSEGGPLDASGLSAVIAALHRSAQRVDLVVSAQPGESRWARQFAVAHLRNAAIMPEPLRHTLVSDSLGDLGAAAGAVAAVEAIHVVTAARASALIYGMSEGGQVGGAVFSATPLLHAGGIS